MKKFILSRLLPWLKRSVKIEVEAVAGKNQCVAISVYVHGYTLVKYEKCRVKQ